VCDCRPPVVKEGQVLRVDTCPLCLPPGAITWLIESGRQLDMFSDPAEVVVAEQGFVPYVDRSVSVSASRPRPSLMLDSYMTQGLCTCDLPF